MKNAKKPSQAIIVVIILIILASITTLLLKSRGVRLSYFPAQIAAIKLVMKNEPIRKISFPETEFTLIEVKEKKSDGEYPSIYVFDAKELKHIVTAKAITFESGEKSIASFGNVTLSPDSRFLFIEEKGFEGGQTYTYDLKNQTLLTENLLDISGTPRWSPNAACVIEEAHFYGDEQRISMYTQTDHGFSKTPSTIQTALGIEDMQVKWVSEKPCTAIVEVSAELYYAPIVEQNEKRVKRIFRFEEHQAATLFEGSVPTSYSESKNAIEPKITYY